MGTDINGWVEIKSLLSEDWLPAICNVTVLVERNYDAFGCLFGVKNHAHFRPIAAERGLPEDLSPEVRQQSEKAAQLAAQGAFLSPSWVLWSELKAIDWEEEAEAADSRLHRYRRNEEGQLVYETKSVWNRAFAEHTTTSELELQVSVMASLLDPPIYPQGQEWEIDGVIYRAEKMRRREALDDGWRLLFRLMETLAGRYGDGRVRLVVWFDV
jgi:hypothetical protein